MKIRGLSIEEYLDKIRAFHGHLAPGMVCGGYMVELAFLNLPEGGLYDAISETRACLPDAIQVLTPCTIGNGWVKIVDTGRFAIMLYDKYTGDGVRVSLDPDRLDNWPEAKIWAMKLKPKKEQDKKKLFREIIEAGPELYKVEPVKIDKHWFPKKGSILVCDTCGESFRGSEGTTCDACLGDVPFTKSSKDEQTFTAIPVEEAVDKKILHDMTRIETGVTKGAAYTKDDVISESDVSFLKSMGKNHVYVADDTVSNEGVHENDAAIAFSEKIAGSGVHYKPEPKEGKIDFKASYDGVLVNDITQLQSFNRVSGVMCAAEKSFTSVTTDQVIGGTRAIPLFLPENTFKTAIDVLNKGPLFKIMPYKLKNVGVIITGTEVAEGRVKDSFLPIIQRKVLSLGCNLVNHIYCKDDIDEISSSAQIFLDEGVQLLIVTGGLSIDPDDVTRKALQEAGLTDELYGSPVLPGAMTLTGRIKNTRVIGVPAGALYFDTTAFDLLLPRLIADLTITRKDLAELADGGLLNPKKLN